MITTAHAHKSGFIFHIFPKDFKQKKKIKAPRPKMTKIASMGGGVGVLPYLSHGHFSFVRTTSGKEKILCQAKQKKVSASTNVTWLKFLRASGWFFLLKFFYTQMQYANLYFSRAGNSNSGTGSLTARRTSLPEY